MGRVKSFDWEKFVFNQKFHHFSQVFPDQVFYKYAESKLNDVRLPFWICLGRNAVEAVLQKYIVYKRNQGKSLLSPSSEDLSDYRVNVLLH